MTMLCCGIAATRVWRGIFGCSMGQNMSHATLAQAPGPGASVHASPSFSTSTADEQPATPPAATVDPWSDLHLRVPSRSWSGSVPIEVRPLSRPKRDTPRYHCVSPAGRVAPIPVMVQQLYPQTIAACIELISQLSQTPFSPRSAQWRCLGAGLDVEDILTLEPEVYVTLPQLLLIFELEKMVRHLAAGEPLVCELEIFADFYEAMASLSQQMFTLLQGDFERLPRLAALLRTKVCQGDSAWSQEAASDVFRIKDHDPALRALLRRIGQLADGVLKDEESVLAEIVHVASCTPGVSRLSRHA